jgi:hypothetical protein
MHHVCRNAGRQRRGGLHVPCNRLAAYTRDQMITPFARSASGL